MGSRVFVVFIAAVFVFLAAIGSGSSAYTARLEHHAVHVDADRQDASAAADTQAAQHDSGLHEGAAQGECPGGVQVCCAGAAPPAAAAVLLVRVAGAAPAAAFAPPRASWVEAIYKPPSLDS